MGCWCETCGVTQLPINAGDKVRVFVMTSEEGYFFSKGGAGGGGTCYSTDRWSPIGPPVQGEYDDYGGVEKIVNDDNAKMVESILAKGWVPLTKENDWDEVPKKLELGDYLHYIERDRGKFQPRTSKEQHLGIMFVLEDVYQAMVKFDSIEAHHYYDERTYEYMPMSKGFMIEFKDWYNHQLEREKSRKELKGSADIDKLYDVLADMDGGRLFGSYRDNGLKAFKKPLQALAVEEVPFEDKRVQKLVKSAMEMLMFQVGMTRARKQWMPQSGKGAQQNDLDIYQVINKASEKIIAKREKEYDDDGQEPVDANGYTPWQLEHNATRLKEMAKEPSKSKGKNAKKGK